MDRLQELFKITHPSPRMTGSRAGPLVQAMNALFISMLGDEHIPDESKPRQSNGAHCANLTKEQLEYFMSKDSDCDHLVDWLRNNYPDMVRLTILNTERLKHPGEIPTKIAVYIEQVDDHVLLKPIGMALPKRAYSYKLTPLASGKSLDILERIAVFYGPGALTIATLLNDEMVDDIKMAYADHERFVDPDMPSMRNWRDSAIEDTKHDVPSPAQRAFEESVAMYTDLVSIVLQEMFTDKRRSTTRWLKKLLRECPGEMEQVMKNLSIRIYLNDEGEVIVAYK